MNFLEKRALARATQRLALDRDEEVLDFDVAKNIFTMLPPPFPFPVSGDRIDLVVTTLGVWAHIGGRAVRYPWRDFLEVGAENSNGIWWFRGLMTSGETFQANLGRSARQAGSIATERHRAWVEREGPGAAAVQAEIHRIRGEAAASQRRRAALDKLTDYRWSQAHQAYAWPVMRDDWEGDPGSIADVDGTIGLLNDALILHDRLGRRMAIAIPYDAMVNQEVLAGPPPVTDGMNAMIPRDAPRYLRVSCNLNDVAGCVIVPGRGVDAEDLSDRLEQIRECYRAG